MLFRDNADFDLFHFKKNELDCLLNLWACPNPHCGCTTIELEFLTEEQYKNVELNGVGILVDFLSREIVPSSSAQTTDEEEVSDGYVNIIENKFDAQDWLLLEKEFFSQKQEVIRTYLYGEDEFPYDFLFDSIHFEDEDVNVNFGEIFPLIKLFTIEIDNIEYRIVDSYCKKVNCECNTCTLILYSDDDPIRYIDYHFIDDKVLETDFPQAQIAINQLKEGHENFPVELRLRQGHVKVLYGNNQVEFNKEILKLAMEDEVLNQQPAKKEQKIGRNEPCPCGSGKKYKKCCLNLS